MRRALIAWAAAGAGDFSIDALKKEAKSLMIPGEKQLDYVCAQILRIKEHELELERKEAQKQLELERKEAQKQLELELERKEAQKQLELERVMMEMNITRTGVLWKLKTQTQRHALELFLFDCWEKMQQFTEEEIRQIRLKNKRFPLVPANATVSDDICVLL